MSQSPITVAGAERLREELEHLKKVERPRLSKAIAEAREHGDLKENAEYHAAREQQGFTEGRIMEIESRLAEARIIDVSQLPDTGKVVFGATVDLIDAETGAELRYQIVGEDEAEVKSRKISIGSPIARALLGKAAGEAAVVAAPGGEKEYEVAAVHLL